MLWQAVRWPGAEEKKGKWAKQARQILTCCAGLAMSRALGLAKRDLCKTRFDRCFRLRVSPARPQAVRNAAILPTLRLMDSRQHERHLKTKDMISDLDHGFVGAPCAVFYVSVS